MKRLWVVGLGIAALMFAVAAYAESSGGAKAGAASTFSAGPASSEASKGAIAMSFGGSTIALWNDEIAIMRPIIEKAGYQFLVDDPQFKIEKQVQDWQAWIAQGNVKAIMGWPIQVDALVPVTEQARKAHIPILGYAVAWKGTTAALLTSPEKDGQRMASFAVAWVKKHYGSRPVEIAVLSDKQNDLTRLRVVGLLETVKKLPNAKVYEVSALTRDQGYTAAKQQLTAHPDTRVWLSYSNDNMKGVYKALIDSHVKTTDPRYFLAGMDVTNEDLNLIRIPNSIYRMAFAFRSTTLAKGNARMLIQAAEGKKVKNFFVAPELVTPANAKQFYVGKVNH
jgi:ABC-type sugar transport system substrate-binding protein